MACLATVLSFGFDPMPPDRMLPLWAELGCTRGQFYRNTDNPPDYAQARRMAEDAGVPIDSMHGVFGARLDPSSPRNAVRRATIDAYRREVDVAHAVGAVGIVVHPSARNPGDVVFDPTDIAARQGALEASLDELAAIGRDAGVSFWIENLPLDHLYGTDPLRLARTLKAYDGPELGMCFDTGHAHISLDEASDGFDQVAPVVRCVHVSDNDGERDSHDWPGEGTIGWGTMGPALARLDDGVSVALELFPKPEELRARLDAGCAEAIRRMVLPGVAAGVSAGGASEPGRGEAHKAVGTD
ncbi:MAG: sugar phosphate isomerase/epimerase [Planctomycetota bacterium]